MKSYHQTLTHQQHQQRINKMPENTAPTEPTEVTLSTEDKLALDRFKLQEKKDASETTAKEAEEAILTESNPELSKCIGECSIERSTPDYDQLKDSTSQALYEINAKFEADITRLTNNLAISDSERVAEKDAVINQAQTKFNKIIVDTFDIMQTRYDEAERSLFSKNRRMGDTEHSIMQTPQLLDQIMKRPYDFMNVKHGESNAHLILTLADRGFMSDTFTTGNGNVFNAANRRFSPASHSQMLNILANQKSLSQIVTKQDRKFDRLKSDRRSIVEQVMSA